jgi:hypothetical protein
VATDLPLDEKHCDSPLLPQNQRGRGSVPNVGLVGQVERGEPHAVVDVGRSPCNGRSIRSCEHTPPHHRE